MRVCGHGRQREVLQSLFVVKMPRNVRQSPCQHWQKRQERISALLPPLTFTCCHLEPCQARLRTSNQRNENVLQQEKQDLLDIPNGPAVEAACSAKTRLTPNCVSHAEWYSPQVAVRPPIQRDLAPQTPQSCTLSQHNATSALPLRLLDGGWLECRHDGLQRVSKLSRARM